MTGAVHVATHRHASADIEHTARLIRRLTRIEVAQFYSGAGVDPFEVDTSFTDDTPFPSRRSGDRNTSTLLLKIDRGFPAGLSSRGCLCVHPAAEQRQHQHGQTQGATERRVTGVLHFNGLPPASSYNFNISGDFSMRPSRPWDR